MADKVALLLTQLLKERGFSAPSSISNLFEGFDEDKLIDADLQSDGKLFRTFIDFVALASARRSSKFDRPRGEVLLSDFIPAISMIQDIRSQRYFGDEGLNAKTIKLLSDSCPWC